MAIRGIQGLNCGTHSDMVQSIAWIHHRATEDTEKFKSFICREIPANESYVSVCGDGVFIESIGKEELHYRANRPCDKIDHYPPKADEQLAHSRYLPRMGKNSALRGLRVSVVNQRS